MDTENDSIRHLTTQICAFRDARNWEQFHSPKDLAVAIVAESGELLQHFVWQSPEQSKKRLEERKEDIIQEMADIAILLFEFAQVSGVQLGEAIARKLALNAERYPENKSRGSNLKYNEL
jgi:NTP pyrophosphatase (non-canonical NTP hydrolase)